MKLRLKKLPRKTNTRRKKFNLERLKEQTTHNAYVKGVLNRAAETEIEFDGDVNKALDQINAVILETAEEEIGFERKRTKPWISDKTLNLADEKRKARAERGKTVMKRRLYNELCRKTKESAKSDKDRWIQEKCKEIQQSFDHSKTKKAYGLIKEIKKKYEPRMNNIKDKTGKLLTEKQEVTHRWVEYCKELYSDSGIQD